MCFGDFHYSDINKFKGVMLLQAKAKRAQKKYNKTTLNSINSFNSLHSNPQIQVLIEKLETMTQEFHEKKANPLNLIEWGKNKYKPTQSQNRIKIENRISIKIAEDFQEKLRPRSKGTKRSSISEERKKMNFPTSYKQHYKQITLSLNNVKLNTQQESEEQAIENKDYPVASSQGFKYYNSLKKYSRLVSYIQDRISQKEAERTPKNSGLSKRSFHSTSNSVWNGHSPNKMRLTSKTVMIDNRQNQLKIDSIIKKWKPASKLQKRVMTCEARFVTRKTLRSKELMLATSKKSSARLASEKNQGVVIQMNEFSQSSQLK